MPQKRKKTDREWDQVKKNLVTTLSHRLRTPLNAIRWDLELLFEEHGKRLDSSSRDILKKVYEKDLELVDLVNDLLLAVELWEGKIEFNKKLVNVVELVEGVWMCLHGLAVLKQVEVDFARPKKDWVVQADPKYFEYVIFNLLDNAIKYTPSGKRVQITLKSRLQNLILEIKDQGIGISKEEQDRVFEIFYRSPKATTYFQDASGIGLFLGKRIMDLMGGNLFLKSQKGKGSRFWMEYPLYDGSL